MKIRMVLLVVVVTLALTPVVLSIGALVLIPLTLVVLPILLIVAVGALPMLLLSAARASEPGTGGAEPVTVLPRAQVLATV